MSSRLQAVRSAAARFAFHRDQHHGWRRAAAWLLACNLLTACALAGYVWLHSTVYIAVAATPDGRLVPLTPLDEPIMSDAALRNWTVSAVTEAFSYLGRALDASVYTVPARRLPGLDIDWRRRNVLDDIRPDDAGVERFRGVVEGGR